MSLVIRHILQDAHGSLVSGFPTDVVEKISIDTRSLKAGDVFFALKGPRFDGHQFLETASRRGAKALVVERVDADFPVDSFSSADVILVPDTLKALQDTARGARARAKDTVVIGITGSNGKTTTKEMLASILRRVGKTLSTRGNLNNHIGLPLMLTELEADHRFAVIEMGTSQKGDMTLLADLSQPQIGLITKVGKDHLEFLGTPEGVLEEKYRRQERFFGRWTRTVTLPDRVESDKVSASYVQGVVTITLPKAESAKPRQISVAGVN